MTDRLSDSELETLFAQVRAAPAEPGQDAMARILAAAGTPPPAPLPAPGSGGDAGDRGLFTLLGGWLGMGGLAAATLAGLWIGIMPPAGVGDLAAGVLGGPVSLDASVEDILLAAEG